MLLTLYGLPPKARYNDVRQLLLESCGLDNVIVDKIVDDGNNGKKVMVGFADEDDARMATQRLNGHKIGHHTIFFDVPPKKPAVFKREGMTTWQGSADAGSSPAGGTNVPPWARRVPSSAPAPVPSPPQLQQQQPPRPLMQNFDSDMDSHMTDVQHGRFDPGPGRAQPQRFQPRDEPLQRYQPRDEPLQRYQPRDEPLQHFQPRDETPPPMARFEPERPARFEEEMRPRWGGGGDGGGSAGGVGGEEMRPRWGGRGSGNRGGRGSGNMGGRGSGNRGGGNSGGGERRVWERSPPRRSPSPLAKRLRIEEQVSSAVQAALRQLSARTLLETLSSLQGAPAPALGPAFAPPQRHYGPPQRDRFHDRRSPVPYPSGNKRRRPPQQARGAPPSTAPARGAPAGRRGAPSSGRGAPGRGPAQRPRSPPRAPQPHDRAALKPSGSADMSRGAETRRGQAASAVAQRILYTKRLRPEWIRFYKRALCQEIEQLAARECAAPADRQALRTDRLVDLYERAHPDAVKHMRHILDAYLNQLNTSKAPTVDPEKLHAEIEAALRTGGSGPAPAPAPGGGNDAKKAATPRTLKEVKPLDKVNRQDAPFVRKKLNIPLLDHYERGMAVYKLVAQLLDTKRISESFGKCFRHIIRQRLDVVLGTRTGVKCEAMMAAYRRAHTLADDRAALDDFKETYIGRNARVDVAKFRAQCILAEQAKKCSAPAFSHRRVVGGRGADPKEPSARRLFAVPHLLRDVFANSVEDVRLHRLCRLRLTGLVEQLELQRSLTVDGYVAKFRKLHPRENDEELIEQILGDFAEQMKKEGEEVDLDAIKKEVAAAREKMALVELLSESDRNARAEAADQILNNMLDHEKIMHKRFVILLHEAILDRIHTFLCDEKDLPAGNIVSLYRQQHPDDTDDAIIEEVRTRVEELGAVPHTPDLAAQIHRARGGAGADADDEKLQKLEQRRNNFKGMKANMEQFRLEGAGEPYYESLTDLYKKALDEEAEPILGIVEEALSLPAEGAVDEHVVRVIRERCAPEVNRMIRVEVSKRILDIRNNLICRVMTFPKVVSPQKVRECMRAAGVEPAHVRRGDRRYMLLAYYDTFDDMDSALAVGKLSCDDVDIVIGHLHAVPFKLDPSKAVKKELVDAPDDSFQVVDSTYDDDGHDQGKADAGYENDDGQKVKASADDLILLEDDKQSGEIISLDNDEANGNADEDQNGVENCTTEVEENDDIDLKDKDGTENDVVHDNGAENDVNNELNDESQIKDDTNDNFIGSEVENDAEDCEIINDVDNGSADERYTYNDAGELFCEPCNRTFKNKTGFNSHMRSHKK